MMKLTIPKKIKDFTVRQKRNSTNTFYVTSEKNPDQKYMVVQHGPVFFCQCGDFFGRKLPNMNLSTFRPYGTPTLELCKHGQFVKEATEFLNLAQGKVDHAVKASKHASTITAVTKALTQPVPKVVW